MSILKHSFYFGMWIINELLQKWALHSLPFTHHHKLGNKETFSKARIKYNWKSKSASPSIQKLLSGSYNLNRVDSMQETCRTLWIQVKKEWGSKVWRENEITDKTDEAHIQKTQMGRKKIKLFKNVSKIKDWWITGHELSSEYKHIPFLLCLLHTIYKSKSSIRCIQQNSLWFLC